MQFVSHKNEIDPVGIVTQRPDPLKNELQYNPRKLAGEWCRVFPCDGKEVRFLSMLNHQQDKFAPDKGHGILVRAKFVD